MKSLEGLRLWRVSLVYGNGDSLWITTRKFCVATAARKARRFLSRHRERYPRAEVDGVSNQGTLDA